MHLPCTAWNDNPKHQKKTELFITKDLINNKIKKKKKNPHDSPNRILLLRIIQRHFSRPAEQTGLTSSSGFGQTGALARGQRKQVSAAWALHWEHPTAAPPPAGAPRIHFMCSAPVSHNCYVWYFLYDFSLFEDLAARCIFTQCSIQSLKLELRDAVDQIERS